MLTLAYSCAIHSFPNCTEFGREMETWIKRNFTNKSDVRDEDPSWDDIIKIKESE